MVAKKPLVCNKCGIAIDKKLWGHYRLCNECGRARARERQRQWRAANPDKVKQLAKQRVAYYAQYRLLHRDKIRQAAQKWNRNNKHKMREDALLRRYGITLAQYQQMLNSQGGACAICRQKKKRTLHVDHNHRTGSVRGLLCDYCNRRLGYLGDNPGEMMRTFLAMFDYMVRAENGADYAI